MNIELRLLRIVMMLTSSLLLATALSKTVQANQKCTSDAHRAFDFWLGDWQVNDQTGKPAGRNKIELVQGGCALRETWSSAGSAFTGTSINFYNEALGQWQQTWVDNQGGSLSLSGGREGAQMILSSKVNNSDAGEQIAHIITWTKNEDGSVRQLWETTTDATTTITFDGLYTKVKRLN